MSTRISIISPRLDPKPWGGRRLERFGLDLPAGEAIGEALVTAGDARIGAGHGEGNTLDEAVTADPDRMLGPFGARAVGGRPIFPLLVKLIDASENLSIQVHPDDGGAAAMDKLGKTEAWHVLASDPRSMLYLGIRPGTEMERFERTAALLDGSTAPLMRSVPATANTTVLIPAGTIHALGAGVMVYEIQQPSDITYRLDDWGRRDAQGNPRDVHLDEGFAVSRPESMPELISPVSLRPAVGERHLLTACRYFALERIALPGGGTATIGSSGSPSVVTILEGSGALGGHTLEAGRSAVVWPSEEGAALGATGPTIALVSTVPDLNALVERLRRAGADVASIAALAGGTGDLLVGSLQ